MPIIQEDIKMPSFFTKRHVKKGISWDVLQEINKIGKNNKKNLTFSFKYYDYMIYFLYIKPFLDILLFHVE